MEEEEWAHIVPGFTFARTSGHLLSLSLSPFSPLFFHSILSLYGHFTLTTGGDYLFL